MKIYIKDIKEKDCSCDALILLFTEGEADIYNHLTYPVTKLIRKIFFREFRGKQNEVFLIPSPGIKPENILLVGIGKKKEITNEKIRQAGGKAAVRLRDIGLKRLALSATFFDFTKNSPVHFIEGAMLGIYSFKKYSSEKDSKVVESITLLSKPSKKLKSDLQRTKIITEAVCFARDLINTPSNDLTPSHLADIALSFKSKNLKVKVIDKKEASRLGMEAYLSVAKGSEEQPKFIVLDYRGAQNPPFVLIGKSITFDSGGLSLKPSEGMEKMKYDMAGGAAVLGVIKSAIELKLPLHLIGMLPAAENLPGGSATRPGDIVRAINGKTIEITNTDAEGRMTLADAIGFAKKYKPEAIIDIATLTGACSIALGSEAIAMMGNNRELMNKLKKASEETYERVWEMPLYPEYKEYLKSDIADMKNNAGRKGALVTAAYFLSEFAGDTPWVHLDIASTTWMEKGSPYIPAGASGIGVRLMLNLLEELK